MLNKLQEAKTEPTTDTISETRDIQTTEDMTPTPDMEIPESGSPTPDTDTISKIKADTTAIKASLIRPDGTENPMITRLTEIADTLILILERQTSMSKDIEALKEAQTPGK